MDRRDLLKLGISAAFIPTPVLASGGGGLDITAARMWLTYYDEDEGEDERITNFYISYQNKYYRTDLTNFRLYDDNAAGGKPTAASALRGARRIGQAHAYYEDGIQGGFASGVYVAPDRVPAVSNAPVLVQAFHEGNPYTLSGSIRFRAIGTRKADKLPERSEFQRRQKVGDLYLNGDTFLISPGKTRNGIRLTF